MTKVSGLGKNLCSVRVWGGLALIVKRYQPKQGRMVIQMFAVFVLKTGFHFFLYFLQLIVGGRRKKFKFACALGCYIANNVE